MAWVITRDYFKQLVKEHWDADFVFNDLKRQGFTIEWDEDALEEVAKRNAAFEQDKQNPDWDYNNRKQKLWEWTKNVAGGLFSSATWFRDFAGKMGVEGAAKVAELVWVDKERVEKARQETLEGVEAPVFWDPESGLYKGAEVVGDIAQVVAPIGWAGKVTQAIDKIKTVSKAGKVGKFVAKTAIQWADDMAKYKAVADEELATTQDLALGAATGVGFWAIGAGVKSVGKAVVEKLPKKLVATALKISPSDQRKFMADTASQGKSPYDRLLERGISGNDDTIAVQIGDYAKTQKQALDGAVKTIPWTYGGKAYKEAMEFLEQQYLKNPLGNEKIIQKINTLLPKLKWNNASASDLLEVKRIFDKSTSIFTVSWDVWSGMQKQWLSSLRSKLKGKLEQVGEKAGIDIKSLSKEIQLSTILKKGLEKRSNVTANNNMASLTDWVVTAWIGGWIWGATGGWDNPFDYIKWAVGVIAAKKILQNPTLQTKLAVALKNMPKETQIKIAKMSKDWAKNLKAAINSILASEPDDE